MIAGTLKERLMVTFAINTRFIRKRPAQAALTVLGLSGVALVFLPFDFEVPLEFFIENLDELAWLTLLGPCVVLPFFISAGYLCWLFTGKLSRWEAGVGYALALMVFVLFSILAIQGWWESLFNPNEWLVLAFLALGLSAAIWLVIQNLRHRASPALTALLAMQLAYLPFALGWLAVLLGGALIENFASILDIPVGVYLAFLTVVFYSAQAALSVLFARTAATATGIGFVCGLPLAFADTAQVLPKGVSAFTVAYLDYKDITERYGPSGDKEDRAIDYNTDLNSSVFPALAPLDPLVGGSATIGRSVVDSRLDYRLWGVAYTYGITDKFSFQIRVPYIDSKNNVDAVVDPSTANVGKNPAFPGAGPALIPIAAGGVPLTTEDVRDLLSQGLDIDGNGTMDIPGFGYEPFGSVSQSGVGDIELLTKYKFHDRGKWRLAAGGGVRLGTGEPDDPDNLMDIPFGDGQSDVLFRLFADYKLSRKWLLNGVFRYDWQLPDKETVRVLDDVNQPITTNRERVDRDLGNILELELMTRYVFNPRWSTSVILRFTRKKKDDIDGELGFNYGSLEEETDRESDIVFLKVEYSTIEKYRKKQARLPLIATLGYRNRYAGKNNEPVSEFVWLRLDFFF